MQRFFLPALLPKVDEVVSLAPIHNQLRRVMRVQPGAQFVILDNAGHERLMEVATVERRDTTARVVELRPAPAEPAVAVTLYQSILKFDKFEWVLQKATELGVATLVPVISRRTVARPGTALANKQVRWEAIVREAAEQSGRGGLPVVAPACTFDEAVAAASGARLLPWEEGDANPGLLAALAQFKEPVQPVSILIGPEGGLEAGEIEAAIAAGWQVVTMGKRILRAETATMAALTLVMAAVGELGDAPSIKLATSGKGINAGKRGSTEKSRPTKEAAGEKDAENNEEKPVASHAAAAPIKDAPAESSEKPVGPSA